MSTLRPHQDIELTIQALGGLGDGIAQVEGVPVFVPHTAPGERVLATILSTGREGCRAVVKARLSPGADSIAPACQHFGQCGGCALQHLRAEAYGAFKRGILLRCVERLGYNTAQVAPLVEARPGARRRADFAISVRKGAVRIGFHAPRSHEIIDLQHCPVTADAILAILPAFRACAESLKKPGNVRGLMVTNTGRGLDLLVQVAVRPSAGDRVKLVAFAQTAPVLRLSLQWGEVQERLAQSDEVTLDFGGVAVELGAGAFLQATALGQAALTERVLAHTEGCGLVADLYCGSGTYSFPLAKAGHRVRAYEGSTESITALRNAARRAGLEGTVEAEVRDLFRHPLPPAELARFDAVVINPPRNGALPQFQALAQSGVKRIVVVSCNPATFERDAQELKRAGYGLLEAVPIDQFTWSPHLELVAAFVNS